MKVLLYLTEACSLCDEALDLLMETPELTGHILETVDIATDDGLFNQYGESIPILEIADQQLFWPFTSSDITNLFRTVSSRSS